MKKITFIMLSLFITISSFSQSICEFNELETMFKAYTMNSVSLWEKAIGQMEKSNNLQTDKELLLQLAYANYGLAGRGLKAAKDGIKYASKLLKDEKYGSEAHALLGGIYGLQIAFNPMKGMFLGPKSDKHVEKALKIDHENAFAYLQKGSSYFNTPAMFGGSVEKSVEQFEKAIALYETEDVPLNLWKLEAMTWLGQAHSILGNRQEAKKIYTDILAEAPEFSWVKSYLLPKLENQS